MLFCHKKRLCEYDLHKFNLVLLWTGFMLSSITKRNFVHQFFWLSHILTTWKNAITSKIWWVYKHFWTITKILETLFQLNLKLLSHVYLYIKYASNAFLCLFLTICKLPQNFIIYSNLSGIICFIPIICWFFNVCSHCLCINAMSNTTF